MYDRLILTPLCAELEFLTTGDVIGLSGVCETTFLTVGYKLQFYSFWDFGNHTFLIKKMKTEKTQLTAMAQ